MIEGIFCPCIFLDFSLHRPESFVPRHAAATAVYHNSTKFSLSYIRPDTIDNHNNQLEDKYQLAFW